MDAGKGLLSILLVEDEPLLRRALARSLVVRGHRVDEAASREGALALAAGNVYDLLLLDVNLPDATGWDVLRDLAAAGRSLPTVVLSAVPPNPQRQGVPARWSAPQALPDRRPDPPRRPGGGGVGGAAPGRGDGARPPGRAARLTATTRPPTDRLAPRQERPMLDLLMLLIATGFFAGCLVYLVACGKL